MPVAVSRSLKQNMDWLEKKLNLEKNDDIVQRSFVALGLHCDLLYMEGMSSGLSMAEHVLRPLMRCKETAVGKQAQDLVIHQLIEASAIRAEKDLDEALKQMMAGQSLLVMDTVGEVFLIDTRSYVHRPISPPMSENVVLGPYEAFNETLRDNLTLLHRKIQSPLFICRMMTVGTVMPTQIALCYMDGICQEETVRELEQRIEAIDVDMVQSGGQLEQLLEDNPRATLPQMASTERPDRAVSFLLEGQAVILMDGSTLAKAMPVGLWHLMHAPDDSSMRYQYSSFTRVIRLVGVFMALILPAFFVTLVIFHPVALPMTLLTSIMESRTVMPISLFGEALLMLLLFNLINEAHTRVPGIMGSSLGLVSALILGSAAVQAQIISPILIIIVAISGLGGYALPDYAVSYAFRIVQIILVLLGWIMGLAGVMFGALLFLCRIAGMTSLNQPYLAPWSPRWVHNPDLIIRKPVYRQRLRGYLANPDNMLRSKGTMRSTDKHKGGQR